MSLPKEDPRWATDATYTPASKAWDNLPIRVYPGSSVVAQGAIPNTSPPARQANWIWGVHGDHLDHLRGLEVQNWSSGADIVASTATTDLIAMCWCHLQRKHFFAKNATIHSSGQGKTWTSVSLPGSGPATFAFITASNSQMVAGGGVYAGFLGFDGTSWALVPTSGVNNYWCAVPFLGPTSALRFVLGADAPGASTAPRIVTLAADFTTTNVITKAMPSGYSLGLISHIAASDDGTLRRVVAAAGKDHSGAATGGVMTYYSSDGVTWTDNRLTGVTKMISDLWWDDTRTLFYLFDEVGALYSSADGISWAATGVSVPNDTTKTNVLTQYGGIWVMVASSNRLMWSVDAGVTWAEIFDTFDDGPSGTQPFNKRHTGLSGTPDGTRFFCLASPNADDKHAVSFSLRCK